MNITQLEEQIEAGNIQAVKDILLQNPSLAQQVTSQKISPLLLACYYQKQEIANIVVEFIDHLTLFEACAVGKFDDATLLIFQHPNQINSFSDDGFTPLGLACYFAHEDLARFLVLKGADVNVSSKNGFNVFPIHSAVAANNINITKMLLDAGAYPNVCQKAGLTPLHTAAQMGNIEIIILLLEHGADVSLRMEGGKLPADLASEKGFNEIAEILQVD
ncbi:ankyrin repeat domain-containing protein [Pedobacter changchengzhani]|uniref:Ankyrin repeat domain-containing protein n=1 Tax=Pedobacter changchengzhani TaxID=2529274 RepID=A0A4R5MMI5_9SPHI|nr:ankyrin repeat domain-containing protein [Pedobacter changchengzhani]TDG36960.1 ankyrin repeat domain-containing protein [Pedobacter changchengzhani]